MLVIMVQDRSTANLNASGSSPTMHPKMKSSIKSSYVPTLKTLFGSTEHPNAPKVAYNAIHFYSV